MKIRKHHILSHSEARLLAGKFFDGETSLAEEKCLYDYFLNGTPAEDLAPYAPLFAGFAGMDAGEKPNRRGHRIMAWWWTASAAAMVAIVAMLGFNYTPASESPASQYALYEGSYVVENGHRNSNLASIMPRLHSAEQEAERIAVARPSISTAGMDASTRNTVNAILDY